MLESGLNRRDVARTFRILKRVDNDLVKELRRELRGELGGVAKAVAAEYPATTDLAGFQQTYGRWEWQGRVAGSVKITPGNARRGAGRKNVVSLSMNFKGAVPYVFDMFGHKGTGNTPQSRVLYGALQRRFPGWPNGGRIFYKKFMESRATVVGSAEGIINRWSEKVSEELR